MQSLPTTRAKAAFARNLAVPVFVAAFAVLMFVVPRNANAQEQVFFLSAPSPGTTEPIGTPYSLTVQGDDQYGVWHLGVKDVTIDGPVYGWFPSGQGYVAIHTFTVVNQAPPPPSSGGFVWTAEMQNDILNCPWFSTYSMAGPYPVG